MLGAEALPNVVVGTVAPGAMGAALDGSGLAALGSTWRLLDVEADKLVVGMLAPDDANGDA